VGDSPEQRKKKEEARCLILVGEALQNNRRPKSSAKPILMHAAYLHRVADWKGWLKPASKDNEKGIKNLPDFYQFQLKRDENEGVILRARYWAKYDHKRKWTEKVEMFKKEEVDENIKHADPAEVCPTPMAFDTLLEMFKDYSMPRADICMEDRAKAQEQWEEYIDEWKPEAIRARGTCKTCHELTSTVKEMKDRRPKKAKDVEDEHLKETRAEANARVASAERALENHLQDGDHARDSNWFSKCALHEIKHHMYQEEEVRS
jgi:hypothetical protein